MRHERFSFDTPLFHAPGRQEIRGKATTRSLLGSRQKTCFDTHLYELHVINHGEYTHISKS
jgi:hypothetical protein